MSADAGAGRDVAPSGGRPADHLASTKLTVPHLPPGVLSRPRLLRAMDAGAQGTLTLLVGPPGVGKTVLVKEWVERGSPPGPVAWVTLDEADDERTLFWRLVIAALTRAGVVEGLGHLSVPGPYTVDEALPALVEALERRTAPVVLVLDDLHVIHDPAVTADIELLFRLPPRFLRVVVVSRRRPRVRLQRLRLTGSVVVIGPEELAFTREEAGEALRLIGATLSEEDVGILWERTEGWAAGLRLAALSLPTHPDAHAFVESLSGDETALAAYLLEEILATLPPEDRRFLTHTSGPEMMCGALADALTGRSDGAVVLADLHQRGAMVSSLDDRREWYRYHPLLRGFLRGTLRREGPELVPELHQRAAIWLAENGQSVAAVEHAVASREWPLTAEIMERYGSQLLLDGSLAEIAPVLRRVSLVNLRHLPLVALALASSALDEGRVMEADGLLEVADRAAPEEQSRTFRYMRVALAMYRSRVVGDLDETQALLEQLRSGEVPHDDPACVSALQGLGALEVWTGRIEEGGAHLEEALCRAEVGGTDYLRVLTLTHLANRAAFLGDISEMERQAGRALALADARGWGDSPRTALAVGIVGVAALLRGELEVAETWLRRAQRLDGHSPELPLSAYTRAHLARVLLLRGAGREAERMVRGAGAIVAGTLFAAPLDALISVVHAQALLALGREEEVEALVRSADGSTRTDRVVVAARLHLHRDEVREGAELLRGWRAAGAETWMPTTRLQGLALLSVCAYRAGLEAEAHDALSEALALSAATGMRVPFAEVDGPMREVLAEHGPSTSHAGLAAELVAWMSTLAETPSMPVAAEPDEPMSDRELVVLRYLPTMMSNREIADELFVSVNTVKTHLRHLYRKLGVSDRRSAVARARALGLLAPAHVR